MDCTVIVGIESLFVTIIVPAGAIAIFELHSASSRLNTNLIIKF